MDEQILNRADKLWRSLVRSEKDLEVPSGYRSEIDRIVDEARKELLR
jgi:hypothetical protein